MPIYEYRCKNCGHEFEKLVPSMTSSGCFVCPECGKKTADKRLSVFAARTAGGGECGAVPGMPRCKQCPGAAGRTGCPL